MKKAWLHFLVGIAVGVCGLLFLQRQTITATSLAGTWVAENGQIRISIYEDLTFMAYGPQTDAMEEFSMDGKLVRLSNIAYKAEIKGASSHFYLRLEAKNSTTLEVTLPNGGRALLKKQGQ